MPQTRAKDGARALDAFLSNQSVDQPPSARFAGLVREGLGDFPLPGGGRTAGRFEQLRTVGRHDLSLARLAEGHADAIAILAEARMAPPRGARLGVWAAGPIGDLRASRESGRWRLDGRRRWCSGAPVLTHALVRAESDDGDRLFLVALHASGAEPVEGTWPAVGMAGSQTLDVSFDAVEVDAEVGDAGFYLLRRGFWIGAVGVAAVWLGGTEAVAETLARRAGADPHRLAHLGAVTARLFALDSLMARAACLIDTTTDPASWERLARIVRAETEAGAAEVLDRTGRATGADPLAHDAEHAQRVADLTVYLRQSHAEADLEALGRIEAERRMAERPGPT